MGFSERAGRNMSERRAGLEKFDVEPTRQMYGEGSICRWSEQSMQPIDPPG